MARQDALNLSYTRKNTLSKRGKRKNNRSRSPVPQPTHIHSKHQPCDISPPTDSCPRTSSMGRGRIKGKENITIHENRRQLTRLGIPSNVKDNLRKEKRNGEGAVYGMTSRVLPASSACIPVRITIGTSDLARIAHGENRYSTGREALSGEFLWMLLPKG